MSTKTLENIERVHATHTHTHECSRNNLESVGISKYKIDKVSTYE